MNKKPGILPTDLKIFKIMQCYRKRNHSKFIRGRYCYDIQNAIRNEPVVKEFFLDQPDKLSRMLYKIKRAIAKGYIESNDPQEPFVRKIDIFGNIDKYNRICDEIRSLILKGDYPKDHSGRLQRKYNMKKEEIAKVWKAVYEPYKNIHVLRRRVFEILAQKGAVVRDFVPILSTKSGKEFKFEKKVAELIGYKKLPRRSIKRQSHRIAKEISPKEYKKRFGHFPDPK
jgi:hypothetical protein